MTESDAPTASATAPVRPSAAPPTASVRPSAAPPTAPASRPVLPRPAVVTAALIVLYLGGIASVALGVLVLLSRYRVEAAAVVPVSLLGAAIALAGLLALAVTSAVGRGDRRARLAVTIWIGVLTVLQVVTIATGDDFDVWSFVEIGLDALVLIALWLPVSSRWFRAEPSTP